MRILVVSDSHGNNENVKKAIEKAGKIDYLIHLGDVGANYREIETMARVPSYFVSGNTDYIPELKDRLILMFGEHRIYAVHGHREGVSMGLSILRYNALQNECDIALYGHTHVPYLDENPDDVTILNPGSVSLPRQDDHRKTYAIIEIDDFEEVSYEICEL
ncbi:MAG: metallophosphoesterase [Lachnospiraceae bacterium]|nr:metallophosphoesterase [Lachnospiraceae bacterium]MBR1817113.1 metallophosphoesterase [Lachnospiraceae bacterium]